jgi:hypothetical protein
MSRINLVPLLIPISLRTIIIVSFYLRLGVAKVLFPVGILVKNFQNFPTFFPHYDYITYPY